MAPSRAAAANSAAVLPSITSRYCASVVAVSFCVISCSTSPSAMVAEAAERIAMTSSVPSSTISWKARAKRKSPTRTEASLPNSALAVA